MVVHIDIPPGTNKHNHPRAGQLTLPDRIGLKFGRWTVNAFDRVVIYKCANGSRSREAFWACTCDCGTAKSVSESTLRNGTSKSCGCRSVDSARLRTLPDNKALWRRVYCHYRKNASKRGIPFIIGVDELRNVAIMDCFYCGRQPSNEAKSTATSTKGDSIFYSGLDRVDNERGYEASNIVPCCHPCNVAKNDMPQEQFLMMVSAIAKKHPR